MDGWMDADVGCAIVPEAAEVCMLYGMNTLICFSCVEYGRLSVKRGK